MTKLPWCEPLALAHHFRDEPYIFLLYSGRKEAHTGRYSYLGIGACETRIANQFEKLPTEGAYWFGYLGYALRHDVEHYTAGTPSIVDMPTTMFSAPRYVFIFDHDTQTLRCHSEEVPPTIPDILTIPPIPAAPSIDTLNSNFTDKEYLESITRTIQKIEAGDFYQANLTRKYWSTLRTQPDYFDIFLRLCDASPAPYSAFLKWDSMAVLSSSPECFLSIDENGAITARPIKGSAGRSDNAKEDKAIITALHNSPKDHAENLMIVDLLRNDLGRVSETGSVEVTEQSGLYSYATIHHLISTIRAKIKSGTSRAQVLKACFPPGSMTGAPKIAAIEWCATQERLERGVYSGAVGWLGKNNQCDFSVVIRTIVLNGKKLEFQVGGGIVADSIPERELEETHIKARGICKALGIKL
jgi:para-aminobenzoate synthetase component 1